MSRKGRRQRDPAGVLVITVWSEGGELRRMVSQTHPEPSPADPVLELQRNYAPNDTAVLGLVRNWLVAVRNGIGRPVPHAVTFDPTIRVADPPDPAGPK